jgi:dolichyl-phosphate-mannose--protein O-mannosyl transferase
LVAAVLVLAAVVRLLHLGTPDRLVFDETFYAQDACAYLGWGAARCGVAAEASWMHPPMGKWLVAAGIALVGNDPVGWRLGAALAGTAAVGLLYLLARRLTSSGPAALLAAGVLALDPLSVVSSRVAMLDGFVAAALVAMVLFATLDRDSLARAGPEVPRPHPVRPWRVAAGIAGGMAVATKWSAAPVLLAVIGLVLLWEVSAARRAGRDSGRAVVSAVPSVLVWLVITPVVVYAASYAGRLDGDLLAPPWQAGAWVRELAFRQLEMARFHADLAGTHPYASPAWSWLLGKRAVLYFFEVDPAGRYREVLAIPNVALWVPGFVTAVVAGAAAVRRRAAWGPELVVAVGVGAAYLPWLVLSAGRSFVFLYYVVPVVPFLALALGWAVAALPARAGRRLAAVVGVVAVAALLFWMPLIYAWPLDDDAWRQRILFQDCAPIEEVDGRLAPPPGGGPPPPGWCWV